MVDNSPVMENVIEYVTTLLPDAYYLLVSIINLGAFEGYYTKVVYDEMLNLSQQSMKILSETFVKKDIRFESHIEVGDPVFDSLSFAKKNEAELFVLETHAGVAANKIKLGGTTASLIMRSHIPILLLGEELFPTKNPVILHPTTGSKYSEDATYLVGELLKSMNGSLKTLILGENKDEVKRRTQEILKSLGVESEFILSEGPEVASIISHAKDADLIVGSRGSPRPSYKLRFFSRQFALDPVVRLTVAFLPKPLLLVCD